VHVLVGRQWCGPQGGTALAGEGSENDLVRLVGGDVEVGFLLGKFQEPSDNITVRKTRGILDATKTNAQPAR
jgi:hypothetical protein